MVPDYTYGFLTEAELCKWSFQMKIEVGSQDFLFIDIRTNGFRHNSRNSSFQMAYLVGIVIPAFRSHQRYQFGCQFQSIYRTKGKLNRLSRKLLLNWPVIESLFGFWVTE